VPLPAASKNVAYVLMHRTHLNSLPRGCDV
jgi:hypothetical protein